MKKHLETVHKVEGELNCNDRAFQASSGPELKKHLNAKRHKPATNVNEAGLGNPFKCNICGEELSDWWNLMNHRRDVHPERRRRCRNDIKDECDSSADECWWRHITQTQNVSKIPQAKSEACHVCEELFTSKGDMMIHKKIDHEEMVPVCSKFRDNKCDKAHEKCWYRHISGTKHDEAHGINASGPQGSWEVPDKIKHPEKEIKDLKDIMTQAMEMKMHVNKTLETLSN